MIISAVTKNRNLVPQWRSLVKTIAARELSSKRVLKGKIGEIPRELVERLENWRQKPETITAAELLEAATVHGQESEAIYAARQLVNSKEATPLVKAQAAMLLKRVGNEADAGNSAPTLKEFKASDWRSRTRMHPHDSLAWVELSLAQVSEGHNEGALKSMAVALQLAPKNRHVLRSATRLLVHVHDKQKAHDLLRRNDVTAHDPWLMAAEIALAEGAERNPQFYKRGLEIMQDENYHPRETTELASTLGTTLFFGGNRRRARQLFSLSLRDPTSNSLAQAEWTFSNQRENLVDVTQYRQSREAPEAMFLHTYRTGKLENALTYAEQWVKEEPFSILAYRTLCHVLNVLERHSEAEKAARKGLKRDSKSPYLLNALGFSLACLGRFDEADRELHKIIDSDETSKSVRLANRGLIELRKGNFEEGERSYRAAIDGFKRDNSNFGLGMASGYFAREAAKANLPIAGRLLQEAEARATHILNPELDRVLNSARSILALPARSTSSKILDPSQPMQIIELPAGGCG